MMENLEKGVLIGDRGYPLEPCLVTEFTNAQSADQEAFNRAFRSLRSKVERAIGMWKGTIYI